MSKVSQIQQLVDDFRGQRPIRAGSLIITVYGDAIAPRGGTVWLGSLIRLLESFGISQRLVRTSVFRLAKDGWLTAAQVGRRSYYSLTESGRRRFVAATRRIYAAPMDEWDNTWRLLILSAQDAGRRELLRKELGWLGFGNFVSGLMAHPSPDLEALEGLLEELDARDQVIVFNATSAGTSTPETLRSLVRQCWKLDALAARYVDFLEQFRPILKAVNAASELDVEQSTQVRILLIHEYRKILLRDPQLPTELLPANWVGHSAHQLCRNLYSAVLHSSERYLSERMETPDGKLPAPASYFYRRFGGLGIDSL